MPCSLHASAMWKKCLKRGSESMWIAAIHLRKRACFDPINDSNHGYRGKAGNWERQTQNAERARQSRLTSAATIRRSAKRFALFVLFLALIGSLSSTLAAVVNYDIVYVRQPR